MSESYNKLIKTLQTIFEMDKADLDFGIYRIMNQKRNEINEFLENDLLPQVKGAFTDYAAGNKTEAQAELDKLIKTLEDAEMDPEQSPKVSALREQMASSVDLTAVENEVYSHLHTFFSRYYDKGDFISQRRYKSDAYAIPYEGEEVKLYWANHDQYYIKSSEHLRDYAFLAKEDNEKSVRIKLVEADTEKDNVKAKSGEERRFVLDEENPLSVEDGELHVHFRYIPASKKKQDKLNEEAVKAIFNQKGFDEWLELLKQKAPTENNPVRTLLEKHLNDYTARNTFDYFIHKDLGGFLRRELDFYIKNEVMHLDDIEDARFEITDQHIRKIKVIRNIAVKLICMLAQLEDFQKKLWLKKKFVIDNNYCITLDRVPQSLYSNIVENNEQIDEWVRLFLIDTIDGYSNPLTIDFLADNPFLILDTAFFDENFKNTLVSEIDDFDEQVDGVLIHTENMQGLEFIENKYRKRIDAIYIDPPYNTVHSKIAYKNDFDHSSWLSLITNGIKRVEKFAADKFSFGAAIDDYEFVNLAVLLDQTFPEKERSTIVVNHHPQGSGGRLSRTHEYFMVLSDPNMPPLHGVPLEDEIEERSFMRSGTGENNWRTGRWRSFYALLLDENTNKIVGAENPVPLDGDYPTGVTDEGLTRIYPINSRGEGLAF